MIRPGRPFSALLLFAASYPAFADKYGIDETLNDRSGSSGDGLLIVVKWALIGAAVGLVVAWSRNRKRGSESTDIGGAVLIGGFLGFFLSLPLHALFD